MEEGGHFWTISVFFAHTGMENSGNPANRGDYVWGYTKKVLTRVLRNARAIGVRVVFDHSVKSVGMLFGALGGRSALVELKGRKAFWG